MTKRLSETTAHTGSTVSLDVRISMSFKKKIQARAKAAGLTMSAYIRMKLDE